MPPPEEPDDPEDPPFVPALSGGVPVEDPLPPGVLPVAEPALPLLFAAEPPVPLPAGVDPELSGAGVFCVAGVAEFVLLSPPPQADNMPAKSRETYTEFFIIFSTFQGKSKPAWQASIALPLRVLSLRFSPFPDWDVKRA